MSELIKKPEKLASAIYLVTSFFDDQEPLKWRLRTLSAELVSERVRDKSSVITEARSLFSLAKTAHLVSEANYDILIAELFKLKQEVEKPFVQTFLGELVANERVLPEPLEPFRAEYIKDKHLENKITKKSQLR